MASIMETNERVSCVHVEGLVRILCSTGETNLSPRLTDKPL